MVMSIFVPRAFGCLLGLRNQRIEEDDCGRGRTRLREGMTAGEHMVGSAGRRILVVSIFSITFQSTRHPHYSKLP